MNHNARGPMTTLTRTIWIVIVIAVVVIVVAAAPSALRRLAASDPPDGFAKSNGRVEAVEIDIAARASGRVETIFAREGQLVSAGETLAKLDTAVLEAQLRESEAQLEQAVIAIDSAELLVAQRAAEVDAARAVILQRRAERDVARKQLLRTRELVAKGTMPQAQEDEDNARFQGATAAVSAAEAQLAAVQAALGAARSRVISARAEANARRATIARIGADIDDSTLRAPRDGRVQYLVAQPGEVVAPGGTVLNLVDLSDVSMTFFLPTEQAGRAAIGAEVRIVLDAAPDYVVPATVSYVADVAQFTPKTVETAQERLKLMFRLKARIEPTLLRRHLAQVKTGLPGVAYVRLDTNADWPRHLEPRLPD